MLTIYYCIKLKNHVVYNPSCACLFMRDVLHEGSQLFVGQARYQCHLYKQGSNMIFFLKSDYCMSFSGNEIVPEAFMSLAESVCMYIVL